MCRLGKLHHNGKKKKDFLKNVKLSLFFMKSVGVSP